tara:strand:+ start:2088 stop:2300 length:213 start_codon:yes stop_codon:yes gene_type:complete
MEIPKVEIIKSIGDDVLGFKIIKIEIDESMETNYFLMLTPFQFQLTICKNKIGIHIGFLKLKTSIFISYG